MKRGLYILILLLLLCPRPLMAQSKKYKQPNASLFEKADQLFYNRIFDSAAVYYNRAFEVEKTEKAPDVEFLTRCLIRMANAHLSDGIADNSRQYISLADSMINTNSINTTGLLAELLYIKGHLNYIYNEPDSATFYLEKSLVYCDQTYNDSLFVLITKDFGNIELSQHDYNDALEYYERALAIEKSRVTPSDLVISSLYQNMSIAYAKKFEYQNANYYFKTSLDIKEQILSYDDILLINAYINYSLLLTEIGEFHKALEFSNLAEQLVLSKFDGGHYLLGHIYHDKSIILERLGRSNQAIIYFEKAIDDISRTFKNNDKWIGQIHSNIGMSYCSIGEFEKAIENYIIALNIELDPYTAIITLKMLADCYYILGKNKDAEFYFTKSIEQLKNQNLSKSLLASTIYMAYGKFLSYSGRFNKAIDFLNESVEISKSYAAYDPYIYSCSLNNLAEHYLLKKEYASALKYYQICLNYYYPDFNNNNHYTNPRLQGPTFFTKNIYNTFCGKAIVFFNQYIDSTRNPRDLISCIETIELATEFSELLIKSDENYNSLSNPSFNYSKISNTALLAYYELIKFNFPLNDYSIDAFNLIEKNKAINLNKSIKSAEAIEFSNIHSSFIEKEHKLRMRIETINQSIEGGKMGTYKYNNGSLSNYKNLRFEAMLQYDSLISFLEKEYPEYYDLKYKKSSPSVTDIQNHLEHNTTLLNYFLTDTNIFIATVSREKFNLIRVSIDSMFVPKAMDYYKQLKKGGERQILLNLSNYLYKILIEPIDSLIANNNRLIIIPHDCIHYIPFETLCKNSGNSQSINFSSLDYLINRFSTSYHYSSTLWLKSVKSKNSNTSMNLNLGFIGFAPVFKNDTSRADFNQEPKSPSEILDNFRSFIMNELSFTELPFSGKEIESISKLYKYHGLNATCVFNNNATEKNFKDYISDHNVIHIATHAFSNDTKPEFSGMVFAHPNKNFTNYKTASSPSIQEEILALDTSNDGILHAGEMYNLDISADLVVLSACETGIGKLVKGEGMIAMTRGLIYSGARNIVYTLWKISDKHTHDFMVDFYTQILNGESYSEALRQAKLRMISNESTAFPKLWSGYMLIGQ